jgi:hypothetical protein
VLPLVLRTQLLLGLVVQGQMALPLHEELAAVIRLSLVRQ